MSVPSCAKMPVFGAMKPMRSSSAALTGAPTNAAVTSAPPIRSGACVHDLALPIMMSSRSTRLPILRGGQSFVTNCAKPFAMFATGTLAPPHGRSELTSSASAKRAGRGPSAIMPTDDAGRVGRSDAVLRAG